MASKTVSGTLGLALGLMAGVAAAQDEPSDQPALSAAGYVSVFGVQDRLNIRAEPTTQSAITDQAMAGTLFRNLGCVPHSDRVWCEVASLDASGPSGWAAATFLKPADPVLRAGAGAFDRIGRLTCAVPAGGVPTECVFGAARDPGGNAAVVVTRPDGLNRTLFFQDGTYLSNDASQAAGGFDTESEQIDGVFRIRIDDERYDIPEALVNGR
jgi:hypothetical protein